MANFTKLPGGAIGGNIQQMRTLSTHFKTSIEELDRVFKGIDSKINVTTWSGPDATKAETQWTQCRAQTMNSLRGLMESLARAIDQQAREQEAASS